MEHLCVYKRSCKQIYFSVTFMAWSYNIIFKSKYKLYVASGSESPPPPDEKYWVYTYLSLLNGTLNNISFTVFY
jgi:hypothetical protein